MKTILNALIVGDNQRYAIVEDGREFPVQTKTKCGIVNHGDRVLIEAPASEKNYANVIKIFRVL